jgi:hypothetical protein
MRTINKLVTIALIFTLMSSAIGQAQTINRRSR